MAKVRRTPVMPMNLGENALRIPHIEKLPTQSKEFVRPNPGFLVRVGQAFRPAAAFPGG
jgi:hypothetical protein